MCGIAGWVAGNSGGPGQEVLQAMTRSLAHRGPDAEGLLMEGPAGFGHRRLAVVDLTAANNQPMCDASGRFLLVFNGEIYNFAEIRKELEALGRAFATSGDTEVVLESLKTWGADGLHRFVGMFALAFWDRERRLLFLARDRLGKKPLFLSRLPDGGLAFASEPRALSLHPRVGTQIDPIALAHYLRLNYVPCNRSLYVHIESLPPGCYAEFDLERGLTVRRYWNLAEKFHQKRSFASEQAAAEELRALLDDAVRIRLVSDVPLGAFLSGGVDSSAVVASMRELCDPGSILTFSSGFTQDTYDESPFAERLATEFGVVHRTQVLDAQTIDLLPSLVTAAGEPLADTSVLPMFFLSKFTRESVTVALSGDGGDECFAGYETYVADKLHRWARVAPRWLRGTVGAYLDRVLPVDHRKVAWPEKLRRFSAALPLDFPRAHASWRNIFHDAELLALMRREWRDELMSTEEADLYAAYFAQHFAEVAHCHPLDQASYVDIKTWLADDILVKVDRVTMAHSLEARCPLLDHRIVEFAAQLPPRFKLHGLAQKHVLRVSQRARLPQWVLRRRKQGFNAPISNWVLGPLREICSDVLFSKEMRAWFDADVIAQLWRDHVERKKDNGLKLIGLLTTGLFLQSVAQRPSPYRPPANQTTRLVG